MHIDAHLDLDLIAVETEHQVSVLVELTAPAAPDDGAEHAPRALQIVLDRSGSMSGDRLDGAKRALIGLVGRLDPRDRFGVVVFDDRVAVAVPAAPLADKDAARRAIGAIHAGGSTDLSAGYLRGLQEARRVAGEAGATVLIVSDGHANAGVTDPVALAQVAAEAYRGGVTTSTLGFGLGYDERLMSAIARGGSGNEHFAEEADTAVALIAGEVEGLLAQTAQAATLHVRPGAVVRGVLVVNDLPSSVVDDGVLVELGSFYAAERRRLVLTFDVPAIADLGPAAVAELTFTYVELPALVQHTVTVPLRVNVVPGDVAARGVPDATVRTELVYLRAQQAKRRASDHLYRGDSDAALEEIRQARRAVADARASAPDALAGDLDEEARELDYLERETEQGSASRAGKYMSASSAARLRKRGRGYPAPPPPKPDEDQAGDANGNVSP
jgi:Ca-activated chloride channel family protein